MLGTCPNLVTPFSAYLLCTGKLYYALALVGLTIPQVILQVSWPILLDLGYNYFSFCISDVPTPPEFPIHTNKWNKWKSFRWLILWTTALSARLVRLSFRYLMYIISENHSNPWFHGAVPVLPEGPREVRRQIPGAVVVSPCTSFSFSPISIHRLSQDCKHPAGIWSASRRHLIVLNAGERATVLRLRPAGYCPGDQPLTDLKSSWMFRMRRHFVQHR